jgi:hypothetical protein
MVKKRGRPAGSKNKTSNDQDVNLTKKRYEFKIFP